MPVFNPRIEADVSRTGTLALTGTGIRLIDPLESQEATALGWAKIDRQRIDDPVLASALFDSAWIAEQGDWARQFSIWRPEKPPARAWFVRESDVDRRVLLDDWSGDSRDILRVISRAEPLSSESKTPEQWTIVVDAPEPGWVLVTQLADPQWNAKWTSLDSRLDFDEPPRQAFRKANEPGGWQCIEVPSPGHWVLRLEYEAQDAAIGLGISVIAWAGWTIAVIRMGLVSRWKRTDGTLHQTERGS